MAGVEDGLEAAEAVVALSHKRRVLPTMVALKDYNYRTPETPLLGKPFDAEALRSKVRELLDAPRTPPAALVAPLPARRHPQ